MDNTLRLLGLAFKAGRLEVGEEPVGASARARKAKLILLAADAAENTVRRAAHFGQVGKVLFLVTPYTKAELGRAVGRASCAMTALTDPGFAAAAAEKLAALDRERYGAAAAQTGEMAARALERQKEQRRHEKKLERAGRKGWAAPAGGGSKAPPSHAGPDREGRPSGPEKKQSRPPRAHTGRRGIN